MLTYVKRLRATPIFNDAYLQSHQTQQHDPQKPVRFMVQVQWRACPQVQAVRIRPLPPRVEQGIQAACTLQGAMPFFGDNYY